MRLNAAPGLVLVLLLALGAAAEVMVADQPPGAPASETVASVLSVRGEVRADGERVVALQPLATKARVAAPPGSALVVLVRGRRAEIAGPADATLEELVAAKESAGSAPAPSVSASVEAAFRSLSDWLFSSGSERSVAALRGQSVIGAIDVPVTPPSSVVAGSLLAAGLSAQVSAATAEQGLALVTTSGRRPLPRKSEVAVPSKLLREGVTLVAGSGAGVPLATWTPLAKGAESALSADLAGLDALARDMDPTSRRLVRASVLAAHGAYAQADAEIARESAGVVSGLPWRPVALRVASSWRASEAEAWRALGAGDVLPHRSQVRFEVTVSRPANLVLLARNTDGSDTWSVLHRKSADELHGWGGRWSIQLDDVAGEESACCVASMSGLDDLAAGPVADEAIERLLAKTDGFVLADGARLGHGYGGAAVRIGFTHGPAPSGL